jgi:hypothetical protein
MGPLKKWHVRPCENPIYIIFVDRLESLALLPATVGGRLAVQKIIGRRGVAPQRMITVPLLLTRYLKVQAPSGMTKYRSLTIYFQPSTTCAR